MRWDRRGFLGASIVAAAYPYARLVAKPPSQNADLALSFEDAGGSTLNTGAENNRAYTKAIKYLDRKGGGTLLIPAKVYPFSGASVCTAANVTVSGYGATFAGDNCRIVINSGSTAYSLQGLTLVETSGIKSTYLMDCYGSACHFKDVHFQKNPPALGYIAYCRQGTFGNVFENASFSGSNGIFLGGTDHQVIGGWGESAFGDDCWAIKSTVGPCYNISISGFRARGFTAIVSIGSEIGSYEADDPDRSMFVRNVVLENCSAEACTYLAYIKPGGLNEYDYRDGLVEDITIRNCQLTDTSGKQFRNGVFVAPGRGAIVRRLNIENVTIAARGASPAVQSISGLYLLPMRTVDGAGIGASIEDVSVSGLRCTDPFGGAATSASAPGVPLHSLVAMEKIDLAVGQIRRIDISDSGVDGCARTAAALGSNLEGPVTFNRCTFDRYAAAIYGSVDKGSVLARSTVTLKDITAIPSPSAPADTRGVMPDANADKMIDYLGDIEQVSLASVMPGTTVTSPIYTSARDTWVSMVEVAVAQSIPASGTNFVRFILRNAASGVALGSVTTANGLFEQAGVSISINGDIKFTGASACIPKGTQLVVEVSQVGSGAEVVDPTFTVHCVPFGVA